MLNEGDSYSLLNKGFSQLHNDKKLSSTGDSLPRNDSDPSMIEADSSTFAKRYQKDLEAKEYFSNKMNKLNIKRELISKAVMPFDNTKRKLTNDLMAQLRDIQTVSELPGNVILKATQRIAQAAYSYREEDQEIFIQQEQLLIDSNIRHEDEINMKQQLSIVPIHLRLEDRMKKLVLTPHFDL